MNIEEELDGFKLCLKCLEVKDIDEFGKNRYKKDGKHVYCKSCVLIIDKNKRTINPDRHRKYNKKHREKYPEKERARHIFRKYKLTKEQYENLLKQQNNCCGICSKQFRSTPNVDHNHITGKVRGLLCNYCNSMLGWYELNDERKIQAWTMK